jgi:ABC-type transport system involved in multi-copper enzyme maturation permease subunit
MQWIVWRQYRLNRTILICGAALLIAPYVVSSILAWYDLSDLRLVENAAICSLCLSQLTLVLLAGNAFAGERADRSAEFLVYLPIARSRRLLGKLILAGLTAAVIWGLNLLVFILHTVFYENSRLMPHHLMEPCLDIGLTILVVFGVSWCLSAVQSSPALAVCGGLLVPMLIIMVLLAVELNPPVPTQSIPYGPMPTQSTWDEETWYLIICLILGLVCFPIGTWRELKRVEP